MYPEYNLPEPISGYREGPYTLIQKRVVAILILYTSLQLRPSGSVLRSNAHENG